MQFIIRFVHYNVAHPGKNRYLPFIQFVSKYLAVPKQFWLNIVTGYLFRLPETRDSASFPQSLLLRTIPEFWSYISFLTFDVTFCVNSSHHVSFMKPETKISSSCCSYKSRITVKTDLRRNLCSSRGFGENPQAHFKELHYESQLKLCCNVAEYLHTNVPTSLEIRRDV